MSRRLTFNLKRRLPTVMLAIFAVTILAVVDVLAADAHACSGLHAGITAQYVPNRPPFTEPNHVRVSFILLNDGETEADVAAGSWKIVIDDVELKDSGMIFGNGPQPIGGYQRLHPGATYQFWYELQATEYFARSGEHKVYWKGDGFRSSTVTVRVP